VIFVTNATISSVKNLVHILSFKTFQIGLLILLTCLLLPYFPGISQLTSYCCLYLAASLAHFCYWLLTGFGPLQLLISAIR